MKAASALPAQAGPMATQGKAKEIHNSPRPRGVMPAANSVPPSSFGKALAPSTTDGVARPERQSGGSRGGGEAPCGGARGSGPPRSPSLSPSPSCGPCARPRSSTRRAVSAVAFALARALSGTHHSRWWVLACFARLVLSRPGARSPAVKRRANDFATSNWAPPIEEARGPHQAAERRQAASPQSTDAPDDAPRHPRFPRD